jgi:hypothetical protein
MGLQRFQQVPGDGRQALANLRVHLPAPDFVERAGQRLDHFDSARQRHVGSLGRQHGPRLVPRLPPALPGGAALLRAGRIVKEADGPAGQWACPASSAVGFDALAVSIVFHHRFTQVEPF